MIELLKAASGLSWPGALVVCAVLLAVLAAFAVGLLLAFFIISD